MIKERNVSRILRGNAVEVRGRNRVVGVLPTGRWVSSITSRRTLIPRERGAIYHIIIESKVQRDPSGVVIVQGQSTEFALLGFIARQSVEFVVERSELANGEFPITT